MSAAKGEPQQSQQNQQRGGQTTPGGQPEITDEQLGLFPAELAPELAAARAAADEDRVSEVIGPDRDDAELRDADRRGPELRDDDDLAFVPGATESGIDFREAGRQAQAQIIADETDLTQTPHELGEVSGTLPEVEPSWTDQPLITDPAAAVGDPDDSSDPVSDLDETYTPPTDPVITTRASGEVAILGGFSADSSGQIVPRRSSDGEIGDEAIADAVRAALRLDAATTDLEIAVSALQGVVRLRGTVPDLDDADNAEAVAAGVEGVVEVQEQLTVANA